MMRQLILDIRPPAAPSLDNFVPGANGELLARLMQTAAGNCSDSLYLWGAPGNGRTHLLQALARQLGDEARLMTPSQLGQADENTLIESLTGTPSRLWMIDDLQCLGDAAQHSAFRCINTAQREGVTLIVSGDVSPRELPVREDLRTRVGQFLGFRLQALSDGDKAAILHRHALERGLRIAPELIDYVMRHARRDIRSLLALLDALDESSLSQKRPVTLPLLRDLLHTSSGHGN